MNNMRNTMATAIETCHIVADKPFAWAWLCTKSPQLPMTRLVTCPVTHLSHDSCLPMIAQHAYWYSLSSLTDCSPSSLTDSLTHMLTDSLFLSTDPWLIQLLIVPPHVYKLGHWVAVAPSLTWLLSCTNPVFSTIFQKESFKLQSPPYPLHSTQTSCLER